MQNPPFWTVTGRDLQRFCLGAREGAVFVPPEVCGPRVRDRSVAYAWLSDGPIIGGVITG